MLSVLISRIVQIQACFYEISTQSAEQPDNLEMLCCKRKPAMEAYQNQMLQSVNRNMPGNAVLQKSQEKLRPLHQYASS
jgi:hypothetical protein